MLKEQQISRLEDSASLLQDALSHFHAGRLPQAKEVAGRVLQSDPGNELAFNLLGMLAQQTGQMSLAHGYFSKATTANPGNVDYCSNLAASLIALGRNEEAVVPMRRALQLAPSADIHLSLGLVLASLHKHSEAIVEYRIAVQLEPSSPTMWNYLGVALSGTDQLEEAVSCFVQALGLAPNSPYVLLNLGNLQMQRGQVAESMATFLQMLKLKPVPEHGPAHNNLGTLLQGIGRNEEATAHFKSALPFTSGSLRAQVTSNLLYSLAQQHGLSAADLFREHLHFGETFEAPFLTYWPRHSNMRDPERVLRVGIVSGDLRNHAVASFIEPLLMHLSLSTNLELSAYYNHSVEDSVSQRLKGYFAHWQIVLGIADENLVKQVQQDGIDILIDLSGHTGLNRLLVFARKPAPVQVSWLGYPGTTGLTSMDYYLADRFFLPPGQFDDQFSEKIVQLPAIVPFAPRVAGPSVNALPAVTNGYFTFGSFNRASKISRDVVALWTPLLRALPDARMVLGGMPQDGENATLETWFAEEGVDKTRLTFYGKRPEPEYMGLHHQVDICLDTFPYNGGTTSFYATTMGVPTLTLAAQTPASRVGACILGQVGLEDFVAHDSEEFVRKGLYWTDHLPELGAIRAALRERLEQSPLGQPALAAKGVESALRTMWRRWCAGLPPESFAVDTDALIVELPTKLPT